MKFLGLICILIALRLCFCARNELIATADCICPGRNFTYECSIVGGRLTVWRGTVISAGCEVALLHSNFGDPGAARRVCNNGAVVGYSIGVENNCYTSNLDVLVSPELNGRTVECSIDDGVTISPIGTATLSITTTPFLPPTNVRLAMARPGELTFSWSPPQQRCPSLTFNVISNNCGTCQNNFAFSNTTCRDFTLPSTCTLTVQSIICGNLSSTESNEVIARLNVPEVPTIMDVYPYYSESDRRLLRLTVNFNTTQPFQIADGIDGSTDFYTVIYSDSTSGTTCGSATISASLCTDEMCAHSFNFDTSTSLCPPAADIDVTVFATNVLGNGSTSEPTFQDGVNNFVDINFDSETTTIICTFLNQPMDTTKECSFNVTYGPDCGQLLGLYTSMGTGDSVSSPELPLIEDISEYCFTVTARSNNVTVSVEGTLNLFEVSNVIDVVTAAVVAPVVIVSVFVVGGVVMTALYYLFRQSLIVIRFSNPDEPGSLAQMLKVFKDNGIHIISINTYWTEADLQLLKWNLCGRSRHPTKELYDILRISCTNDEKVELQEVLKAKPNIKLEFIEDDDSVTTGSTMRTRTVKVYVDDKPGTLWEFLNELGTRKINILGLNTHSNYGSTSESEYKLKDNFVSCKCSRWRERKLESALIVAGALNVKVEYNIRPSTRTLQFYVKDEPGALANVLKAFSELNINISGINLAYMNSKLQILPGHQTIYVECQCGEDERETLFEKLRKSSSDAIQVQLHDDQQVISRKRRDHQNYCIVKFSIQDKVGSLVSALEVFQDLNINILGVNSFAADPSIELRPDRSIEYKRVQMVVSSESDIKVPDLLSEFQSSGHIIDIQCNKSSESQGQVNYNVEFLIRQCHQVRTLGTKALSVFIGHDINIISLSQESVSRDVRYVHNRIRFEATNQQQVTLISQLHATGLVMDVETLPSGDDHHIAKMKESHTHRSTIKGEVDGNAFEQVFPPSNITLSEINTDQLIFTWNSIYANLSGVQYFVSTSNCGMCPNTTYSTSLRCDFINITSNLHECSLTILTIVCGRIGSGSDLFIVTIKVPHPPRVQIVQAIEDLTLIITAFNKTELISLNDGTTVLVTSYTISYSDSSTGQTCGLSTIPASSCGEKICSNVFEVSSTSCFNFTNIAVSFFASSRLGSGPASRRTLITLQQYNNSVRGQDCPICMDFGDITNTLITSGVVALLILILITAVFVSVTVLLIRSKLLMQKELKDIKENQDSRKKGDTVYDEIKPLPESTVIETTENTAYTCISRVCANASL